jgi:hypothetical protein
MAPAPGVSVNFLALQSQSVEAAIWRQRIGPAEAKPADALCYTLPVADDQEKRASYLISLDEEPGYTPWRFHHHQNRQLALRYIFEVAYSERCRSAFRTDGDRDSKLMPITIPK